MQTATIGFRAKTGRAIAIALKRNLHAPEYLARWEVALYDPTLPAPGPHHHVMDLPWSDAQLAVRPLERKIESIAINMLAGLMTDVSSKGFNVSSVGVVGSPDRQLERIGNPHIRAHAAEGILFRRVLEIAAAEHKLHWRSFSDRAFEELTFPELRRTPHEIKSTLAEIGRSAGRPWRADERAAAVAAWVVMRLA